MLPIDGYRLGRGSLGRATLAELSVQVPRVPLGVGKLPHVVRGASEGGCTFVTLESLAQSPLHPILPGLLDDPLRILRHAFLRGRQQQAALCGGAPLRCRLLEGENGDRRRVAAQRVVEADGVLILDICGHECHGYAGRRR